MIEASFFIKEGKVYSNISDNPETFVKNQLKYLFGALNEVESGIDFPRLKVKVKKIRKIEELFEISYSAEGLLAWNANVEFSKNFIVPLPKRGDNEGLQKFVTLYQANCAKKPASIATFWNYYRPHHYGCTLTDAGFKDVVFTTLKLKLKNEDEGRWPNYRQVFEDGVLEITAIITKENPLNSNDVSHSDFKSLCSFFATEPVDTRKVINECHSEFLHMGQVIKAHAYLLADFNDKPQEFFEKIRNILQSSDVVTYNGHSGMGLNIESWIHFYPIPRNKYQIIFLNSCDTYGYFHELFFDKVKKINDEKSSGEYLDVILNSTQNYFGSFTKSNSVIVNSLILNENFDSILKLFPAEQHSVLLFEN